MQRGAPAALGLFAACLAAACGGNSTPIQPSPTILPTGAYRLTLHMSASGEPTCTGAGCAAVQPCGTPGGVVAVGLPMEVRAEHTGNEIAIRPVEPSATLRLNLRTNGNVLSGTASGEFPSGHLVMAVTGATAQSAAVVTGIAVPGTGPPFATGTLEGVIMFNEAGCSNNAHRWNLDAPLPF